MTSEMLDQNKKIDIAIIHANLGYGHVQAAYALNNAFNRVNGKIKTEVLDSLDFANPSAGNILKNSYFYIIKKFPWMWEMLYKGFRPTDRISLSIARRLARVSLLSNLKKFIIDKRPRAFVATHFFPPPPLIRVRDVLGSDYKVFVCITDYDAHPLWQTEGVDGYFVANELARDKIINRGVDEDRVFIKGVPINPIFAQNTTKDKARKLLGLPSNKTIIVISGGGEGVGPIYDILKRVDEKIKDTVIMVICGKNRDLYNELKIHNSKRNELRILGFVNNIHLLYNSSDLFIGKTGGLTSAEILAKALPAIAIEIIKGQERRNLEYLIKSGGLIFAENPEDASEKASSLINNPDLLKEMSNSMKEYAKPSSSIDIAEKVIDGINLL
jgi:processive 1,2-diacylglycerol beta-glucosyltransferase